MMFFLIANVMLNDFNLRFAHRKRGVPDLPRKTSIRDLVAVNPFRGIGLNEFEYLSNGFHGLQLSQDVNVIGDAADFYGDAAFSANDAANVAIKFFLPFVNDQLLAIFGTENGVVEEIRIRRRH